jgi:hypothetical protein
MAPKKKTKKAPKKPAKKLKRAHAKKPAKRAAKRTSAKRPARAASSRRPVRRAAKTAKTAKTVAKRAPAKTVPARAKALRRRDGTGHLDPQYEAELHARRERETDPTGFIVRPRSKDDLVEELGEEFVGTATSGEYEAEDKQNQRVTEEIGGPFVETSGSDEFADGTDASNPKSATREPFPRT